LEREGKDDGEKKNWTDWHLKKGAAGAVGENSPQKQPNHGKMKPSTALERRNGVPKERAM
jgi:hypothetical protein